MYNCTVYALHLSDKAPTDHFKQSRETLEKRWQFHILSHHSMGLNSSGVTISRLTGYG
jgi:hypothetical protein